MDESPFFLRRKRWLFVYVNGPNETTIERKINQCYVVPLRRKHMNLLFIFSSSISCFRTNAANVLKTHDMCRGILIKFIEFHHHLPKFVESILHFYVIWMIRKRVKVIYSHNLICTYFYVHFNFFLWPKKKWKIYIKMFANKKKSGCLCGPTHST